MKKRMFVALAGALLLSGCAAFNYSEPVYQDPVGEGDNVARIRFIGNVTGTSITTKDNTTSRNLVPHTSFGYYNDTRDIGMPKLTYRPQDYQGYYFEVRAKPLPTVLHIVTDRTDEGTCGMSVLIFPEAGKDYDVNFDAHEQYTKCVFHFNEIVTDPATGVKVLKARPFKKLPFLADQYE